MTRVDEIKHELRESVLRGAQLLDQHQPGWEHLIDLETLQLNNCFACTAGQAFAVEGAREARTLGDQEYSGFDWLTDHLLPTAHQDWSDHDHTAKIKEEQRWLEHYGFDVSDGVLYEELQHQWEKLIHVRQRIRFEHDEVALSAQS